MSILGIVAVILLLLVVIGRMDIIGAIVVFLLAWLILTVIGRARGPRV